MITVKQASGGATGTIHSNKCSSIWTQDDEQQTFNEEKAIAYEFELNELRQLIV